MGGRAVIPLRRLERLGRESRLVRGLYQWFRALALYGRSLPDWLRWLGRRRKPVPRQPDPRSAAPLHIVMVARHARVRELKLAHAARLAGCRVSLLADTVQWHGVFEDHVDTFDRFINPFQALNAIHAMAPDVVHVLAANNNWEMLPLILYSPCPTVYDPYDCARSFILPRYQYAFFELEAERLCLERADHICARSLEPVYLRRKFGYRLPPTTFFPDYCWNAPVPPRAHPPGTEREFHIVYCGNVVPEDRTTAEEFGYAHYLEVTRRLTRLGLHFHIYPAKSQGDPRKYFSLYFQEAAQNPRFHFHSSLSPEALRRKLPSFDAALHISGVGIHPPAGRITAAKAAHSTANKLFDYLEAGLPVIIHRGRLQRALVRHYGQAIEIEQLEEIPAALRAIRPTPAHSQPTLAAHAHRLGRMYRQAAANTIRFAREEEET